MMHGREKSDPAIVAVKPANKTKRSAAETVGAKGRDQGQCGLAKHALDSAPGSRGTGARPHAAIVLPRGGSRVRESRTCGLCGGREVTRVPTANPAFAAMLASASNGIKNN